MSAEYSVPESKVKEFVKKAKEKYGEAFNKISNAVERMCTQYTMANESKKSNIQKLIEQLNEFRASDTSQAHKERLFKKEWDEPDDTNQNSWGVVKNGNKIIKKFGYKEKKSAEAYANACTRKSSNGDKFTVEMVA
jgi:hypothetical protein